MEAKLRMKELVKVNNPIGAQKQSYLMAWKRSFARLSASMYPLIANIIRVPFNEDFRDVSGQIKFSSGLGVFRYHYFNRWYCTWLVVCVDFVRRPLLE